MSGFNKVVAMGNLGSDPEVKYTPAGKAVCNFSIAVNEKWTDKNGEKQERTEWIRVVVWDKLAELCGEYLSRGRQALVEGRLQTREWTNKEGAKQYTTEVVATGVTFVNDGKGKERSDSAGPPQGLGGVASDQDFP